MALRREVTALTEVLADPANEQCTADQVAERCIAALDGVRASTHRLAVLTNYGWGDAASPRLAVIGPFSTRSTAAARAAGEAMAGTPQGGSGKWLMVPAYANARVAWDAIRPEGRAAQRAREVLERVRADLGRNNPSLWDPLMPPGSAATCCCGLKPGSYCMVHDKRNS